MTGLLIISIILSAGAIVLLWLFLSRVSYLAEMVEKIEKANESLRNDILGLSARLNDMETDSQTVKLFDGVVYDEKSSTMTVKGNSGPRDGFHPAKL